MLSFLSNPVYKLISQIGLGFAVLVAIYIGIKIHDSNIKSLALQEFNKAQLEETLKNQKEYIDKLNRIEEAQILISKEMSVQKSKLTSSLSDIEVYLSSPKIRASSKQVSPIIQYTINKLREQE